jgi:hypothetical protein
VTTVASLAADRDILKLASGDDHRLSEVLRTVLDGNEKALGVLKSGVKTVSDWNWRCLKKDAALLARIGSRVKQNSMAAAAASGNAQPESDECQVERAEIPVMLFTKLFKAIQRLIEGIEGDKVREPLALTRNIEGHSKAD